MFPNEAELSRLRRRKARLMRGARPSKREEMRLRTEMGKLWHEILIPAGERIKQLARQGASPQAVVDEIDQALYYANMRYSRASKDIVDKWLLGVDRETQSVMWRAMKSALGIDLSDVLARPDIAGPLSLAGLNAASMIRTIPQLYLSDVAKAVADAFAGIPQPEDRTLAQQIDHLGSVGVKRSKLIARDQTSKLTAELQKQRMLAVGVSTYFWRTVRDHRVVGDPVGAYPKGSDKHGDHYHLDGKLCRWDDPTMFSEDGGKTWKKRPQAWSHRHPGEDILCRCWAEPVVDPFAISERIAL